MEQNLIEEPQRTYLLELLTELGGLAEDFILVGGQALKFFIEKPRVTKDFDFVLNVMSLRQKSELIDNVLSKLGYQVEPSAVRFQFYKEVPKSNAKIRIEFLAPETEKRRLDFRVDVQRNVHARSCPGGEIAIKESEIKVIEGKLPDGQYVKASLRVIRPHALLMLKLFAMDDRMKNIRGPKEAKHDRDEARIHTGDIVNIVREHIGRPNFKDLFWSQFGEDTNLKQRANTILFDYFADLNAPGIQLYREFLKSNVGYVDEEDLKRALREARLLLQNGK
jgi:hypothetical protein